MSLPKCLSHVSRIQLLLNRLERYRSEGVTPFWNSTIGDLVENMLETSKNSLQESIDNNALTIRSERKTYWENVFETSPYGRAKDILNAIHEFDVASAKFIWNEKNTKETQTPPQLILDGIVQLLTLRGFPSCKLSVYDDSFGGSVAKTNRQLVVTPYETTPRFTFYK